MGQSIQIKCQGSRMLPVGELKPFQGNLKTLTEANYLKLKGLIINQGFSFPIFVWCDKENNQSYIIDGHQRVRTLHKMVTEGFVIPEVPVAEVHAKSFKEAKKKLMSAASQFGDIDKQGLYEYISQNDFEFEFIEENFKLPEVDFKAFQEEYYKEEVAEEDSSSEDKIDELRSEINVKPGDIWTLGNHSLMCGDATNIEHVQKLIGKEVIEMVFTDPPWGVNVRTEGKDGATKGNKYKKIENDDSKKTAIWACKILLEMNIEHQIIWGANQFHSVFPDGKTWLVWDKEIVGDIYSAFELAYTNKNDIAKIFKHRWHGMIKDSEKGEARVHPTQKPVALVEWCINTYGNPDTVLDVFAGSGSTLIACEKLNKTCFAMEVDPYYCQVIIDRWEKFTESQAIRET